MKKYVSALTALFVGVGSAFGNDREMVSRNVIEFSEEAGGIEDPGSITNDDVMGGLSEGNLKRAEGGAAWFYGTLSLENNGGFSSWEIAEGEWDFSEWTGVQLRVLGDGRTYKVRLATDERHRSSRVSFQAEFKTTDGEWTVVRVPFSKLKANWRGENLETAFDAGKVERLGVILADKKEGSFSLKLSEFGVYRDE